MTDLADNLIRFNEFELDLASRELRADGTVVSLEPRVFSLLVYLYEHRRRAVDKDEIQDVVWKGVIVSETALTRAIMKARRAVGDSAEKQAVIRTVHGHGYQFVATPVQQDAAANSNERAARLATPRVFTAAAVLVLVSFIIYLWPTSGPDGAVRLAIMPIQNATNDPEYDWTRLGLMGFANDLMSDSAAVSILAASNVMAYAERKASSDQGDGADSLGDGFAELGRNYGANHMLVTTLEQNAGVLRLSYSLFQPDGGIERGTMVGAEPTELMRGMILSIGASLGTRARPVGEITVVSKDPFINAAYSRGLSFSLEGRCAEAAPLFEIVVSGADGVGRAHLEWAGCARILGQWQEAEAGFKEILEVTPAEPASTFRAQAYNGLGTVYLRTGRGDLARETLRLGLSEAVAAGDLELQGRLLHSLAIDAKNRREYDEARDLLARATLAYTEADVGILPGQVPAALANIDMGEGKLDQADKHLTQALATFRALGDRRNEAMMLNNTGYLRRLQDRPEDAEPLHLQSLAIRREIGDTVGQGRILGMLSSIYEESGRIDEARSAATEAYRIARDANDRLFMATGLAQLAAVESRAGNLDVARLAYIESRELFEEINDYSRSAQVTIALAYLYLREGEFVAANQSAREVREVAMREAMHEPAIEAMVLSGDIASADADPERAITSYRDALEHMDQSGFVARKASTVIKLANVLMDQGDLAGAQALIGYLIEAGNTAASLKLRARYAFMQGESERAVSLQKSALSLAEDGWSDADAATLAMYQAALGPQIADTPQ
jgi:DNA-binding winged helix-turn-helix (wHTH) protein/tetratricopeptide (TPR) repeat protein